MTFDISVYSPDMPKRLPVYDILTGLVKSIGRALRYWLQSTLVAVAWLGVVPLTACKYLVTPACTNTEEKIVHLYKIHNICLESFLGSQS